MTHTMPDQRLAPRTPVCLSAIVSAAQDGFEQAALLRDMSESGLFFYCKFDPQIGSEVSVRFNLVDEGESNRMLLRGKVVRVVKYPGAATGVAVSLHQLKQ
jgi:hypothetical protein